MKIALTLLASSLALPALAGDPAFRTPSRSYHTGNQDIAEAYRPSAQVVADLDGDGDPDLALSHDGNFVTANVSVHLNQGDGSYGPPVVYPAFGETMDVVAADLDGDGDLDLAYGQSDNGSTGYSALVYLNNGDGTFAPYSRYTVGTGPVGIAAFDADGDGDLDLATANARFGEEDVSVLYNDGSGTFGGRTDFPVPGYKPYRLAAGDMDGDGNDDLVVAPSTSLPIVAVLISDGAGGFAPAVIYQGTGYANLSLPGIALGDLNNDGDLDVVMSQNSFENLGNGTLAAGVRHPTGTVSVLAGVAIADVDGDGWNDVLGTGHSDRYGWGLFRNDGSGGLLAATAYRSGEMARDVAAADTDGDGDLDVIVANAGSNTFTVHENEAGAFSMPPSYPQDSYVRESATGDLDGDGDVDIVSTYTSTYVHLNNGDGTFSTTSFSTGLGQISYAELVDLTGDGHLDLMVKAYSLYVAPGNGDGTFASFAVYSSGGAGGEFVTPDLDGDGDLDVVIAGTGSPLLAIYLNQGGGVLAGPTTENDNTLFGGKRIVAGDVDNDGIVDILQGNGDVITWLGIGDGTFATPFVSDAGDGGTSYMTIGDYDLDGNLDLAATGFGSTFAGETLTVLRGYGDGAFMAPWQTHGMFSLQYGGVSGLEQLDLDNDGYLDLVGGCYGAADVCLFMNNGDGTFAPQDRYGVDGEVLGLRPGDFDGDGITDLVVNTALTGGGGASILFGESLLPAFETYCTAKTNSQGCVPWITASGEARVSSTQPFVIEAHDVLNNKVGIFFYGLQGQATIPFQGGLLCAFPPVKRTPLVQSGGNPPPASDCSGVFAFDFNAFMRSTSRPDLVAGAVPHGQFWSRDPQSPSTTGLTDAILIRIKP